MSKRPAFLRFSLMLTMALAIAGCDREAEAPVEAAAPAAPVAAPATDAAPVAAPVEAATPRTPGPVVPPQGPAPVLGEDYVEIPNGTPFQPGNGIEVAEVFGYTCPHCASFEPLISAWKARAPADVNVVPVAAPFGGYWVPYAKAYYAAEALGVDEKTHQAVFNAIHLDGSLPVQPQPTDEQLAAFYAKHGVDPKQFIATLNSFAVNAKLKQAMNFIQRSGVEGTPTLVVNGKYRITTQKGFDEVLRVAEHLVAQDRAATGATAPAGT